MINVAGQVFIQYYKELDESNQVFKSNEIYFGDDKTKNIVLNKDFETNEIYKKVSINRYIKYFNNIKRELH